MPPAPSHFQQTIWKEFDLGNNLDALAGPFLGSMDVTVVDASSSTPIEGAVATVTYVGLSAYS